MKTKDKKSQVKMNDVITTLGEIVASTGCRVFLHQPKTPEKITRSYNNKKHEK